MHDIGVYQSGDTIRLSCELYDFDGLLKDPDFIQVKFYDSQFNIIEVFTNVTKLEIGKYYLDYVPENVNKKYYYEWYVELDGKPSLRRSSFVTKFI